MGAVSTSLGDTRATRGILVALTLEQITEVSYRGVVVGMDKASYTYWFKEVEDPLRRAVREAREAAGIAIASQLEHRQQQEE